MIVYVHKGSCPNGFLMYPSFANPSCGFAVESYNPFIRPSNYKGSVIKEALVVFRCIEKQGSAQGLPMHPLITKARYRISPRT
ncbi:MAG: hypothetical protein CMH44_03360 [Muricauda sp.]|nr:hypothetical protein [Allomuricauda sp.]